MNKLGKIQKWLLVLLVLAFAGMLVFSGRIGKEQVSVLNHQKSIGFSVDSGFYSGSIAVGLSAAAGTEIYYTLDGSEPTPDNQQACKYENKVLIEAQDGEYACTIRAAAYEEGVRVSDIESRSYVMGVDAKTRFSMPVLVVSGSPEDFYNYEDGIMVHGKLDEEYKAAHPEFAEAFAAGIKTIRGNFYQSGREAEKEVAIALFDKDGNRILEQNGGFRVYGEGSRMKNQPSFRLYARSEYDEIKDFDYPFFADQYTCEGTLQSEYKRVIVRNSGNDNGYGFIRSELATRIAKEAGFTDAPSASPVCVYLNGEYYGVHWFITNFDDTYFAETYGEYTGEMYIFEGTIYALEVEDDEDETYLALAREYEEQVAFFETADLTVEENWQKLNAFMDVDNFIHYMAINDYLSNDDTLFNNFRIYRYYAPDGQYQSDTVFDGRIRFLMFDLDHALGLKTQGDHSEKEKYTLTAERMEAEGNSQRLFANIMQREDCRQLFIRYSLSCMNYYYSEAHVKEVLEEMHAGRAAELDHMLLDTDLMVNNHDTPENLDLDYIAHQMFLIERYASLRPEYVKQDLREAFGEMTEYTLHLQNPEEASITLDFASMHETEFEGSYFVEVPLCITARPRVGYTFDYWLVNGVPVEGDTLSVTAAMLADGQLSLECVCSPGEDADLCISGIKARDGDLIQITNVSTEDKNLGAYCLSDNTSDRKSTLPAKKVKAGETVTVYCKNYSEIEALGQPVTNFNVKEGETISLYRTDGTLVDSVVVPNLGSGDGIWQMDRYTGSFKEVFMDDSRN